MTTQALRGPEGFPDGDTIGDDQVALDIAYIIMCSLTQQGHTDNTILEMNTETVPVPVSTDVSPWSTHDLEIIISEHKYLPGKEWLKNLSLLEPRTGHSSSVVASPSGDIFIFGGKVDGQLKNDTWLIRFSECLNTKPSSNGDRELMKMTARLVQTTGTVPSPRHDHASVLAEKWLVVWGGDTGLPQSDNNVYLLDIATYVWSQLDLQPAPCPRGSHPVCICQNQLVAFGGCDDHGRSLNDLWSLDLDSLTQKTAKWKEIKVSRGRSPFKRHDHAMVAYKNKLYVFGGYYDGDAIFNDTWCFDMNAKTWTELDCIGPTLPRRSGHAVALVGDVVYMFGGWPDHTELGNTWCFRITEKRWYPLPDMGLRPSLNLGHTMATIGERIIYVGQGEIYDEQASKPRLIYVLDTASINLNPENSSEGRVTPDTITGVMPITEVFTHLTSHNCHDITQEFNESHITQYPVSNGGNGDVYRAELHDDSPVAVKCARIQVERTDEGRKLIKENILISDDYIPKLTDFGNAMLTEYTLQFTQTTSKIGFSLRYAAPEIIEEEKATQASDVFALGMACVFIQEARNLFAGFTSMSFVQEVIARTVPYGQAKDPAIVRNITIGKYPSRPEMYMPSGVEQADLLWDMITRCWAFSPNKRPKAREIKDVAILDTEYPKNENANENVDQLIDSITSFRDASAITCFDRVPVLLIGRLFEQKVS
ncbi:Kelch motif, partial [Rhizoctonia solani]